MTQYVAKSNATIIRVGKYTENKRDNYAMGMGVNGKARGNEIFSRGHCIRKNTAAAADSHSDAIKCF